MAASRVRTASDGRGISACFMSPPPPFAPNRAPATIVKLNQFLSPAAALGAAATLGVADFTGGVAGRRTPPASVAIGIEAIGLVALPLAIWLLPERLDPVAALLAFTGGMIGGLGLIAFYRAMSLDLIGVVAPITAVIAAALPTAVGVLVAGEKLHLGQGAGIVAGLVAIAMINGAGGRDARLGAGRALGLAIVAGVGFGLFFILYHAGSSAGVTAFVSGRAGSAVVA